MRYTAAIFLFAWVWLAADARAAHVQPTQSLNAGLLSGPMWDFPLGKPMPLVEPWAECALTGICEQKLRLRKRCADRPGCIALPPLQSGQGAGPRGYAFGIDKSHTMATGTAAEVSIPPSALLLLGCALLIPLLLPRRTRGQRH